MNLKKTVMVVIGALAVATLQSGENWNGFVGPRSTPGLRGWAKPGLKIGVSSLGDNTISERHIRAMVDAGIDYVAGGEWSRVDRNDLDNFHKFGLGVVLGGVLPHWWGGGASTKNGHMAENIPLAKYDEFVQTFKDHPAIWALSIGDEPSALDFPHYGQVVRKVMGNAPNQWTYLNIYPNYALPSAPGKDENALKNAEKSQLGVPSYRAYIAEYCKHIKQDYIHTDIYPFAWKGVLPAFMIENMRAVADAALASGRFWGVTIQANRFNETYGKKTVIGEPMNVDKARFQAFNALAFGAENLQWACWTKGWWFENIVEKDGTINEHVYNFVKTVNFELKRIAKELDQFRRISTDLVGYRGTVLDLKANPPKKPTENYIHQVFVDEAHSAAFTGVKTKSGSALTVGHFLERNGAGRYAMLVVPVDHPYGDKTEANTLIFTAPYRKITAIDGKGEVAVKSVGEGAYEIEVKSNQAVFVIAD